MAHCWLGTLYLAQGDLSTPSGCSTRPGPLSRLRQPELVASDRGGPGLCLCAPGAPRGGARAAGGGDQRSYPHGCAAKTPPGRSGSVRSVGWRDAVRRPGARAKRSTWPDSRRNADEALALHQLGAVQAHADPPDAAPAEAHYQQALALAEELSMRPLVAHCHPGWAVWKVRPAVLSRPAPP